MYRNRIIIIIIYNNKTSQVALVVKNLPADAGDTADPGLTPGSVRSPGVGNSNPLQYSCLGNSMDRGSWWATVHGASESQTLLSNRAYNTYKEFAICQTLLPVLFLNLVSKDLPLLCLCPIVPPIDM